MIKKTLHSIFIFFCTNIIFSTLTASLTPEETALYNKAIWEYRFQHRPMKATFDQFLTKNNLSPEQLYTILQKKDFTLASKTIAFLESLLPQKQSYRASNPVAGAGAAVPFLASFFFTVIGTTSLALSSTVNSYISPSKPQKFISSALKNFGIVSLIPEALIELFGNGIITGGLLPGLYEMIIPKTVRSDAHDIMLTPYLIQELKEVYPELDSKLKTTSP